MTKCVVIPAIATSMLPDTITMTFIKLSWSEFVELTKGCERIINFNRHKSTNDLLMTVVGKFEAGFEYKIDVNDVIIMVGLRARTPASGAELTVTPDDLLVYLAKPAQ